MTRVLVLSELWYPQGGGAELATYLYTKRMLDAGLKVTLLTNRDASLDDMPGISSNIRLPFGVLGAGKAGLLLVSPIIERKVKKLAASHDIAYMPGKLLFLAPALKRANPSLRIIVHLHDYQLVCPHASLYNFNQGKRCEFIWSDSACARCTYRYEAVEKGGLLTPLLGASETFAWRYLLKTSNLANTLDSVNSFITVSEAQKKLIADRLGRYSTDFIKKNTTLYNPVDVGIGYVSPSFSNEVCLGFFGGDRYLKGFDSAVRLVEHFNDQHLKLIVTKVSTPSRTGQLELLGTLNKQEMVKVFKRIWVVLFMSRWDEPLPYIIVEAQLRGRPALAIDVGGVNEAIAKLGVTGDVVDGDYNSFVKCVEKYSALLTKDSSKYTKEISALAKDFFEARSMKSYDVFLKILS